MSPVTYIVDVPAQDTEVKAPHEPENSCIRVPDVDRFEPIELNTTEAFVPVAVNLYQTSSSGSPDEQPTGTPALAVASQTVPELFVEPIVNVVAFAQSSFAGGPTSVMQILKVAFDEGTGLFVERALT